MLLRLGFAGSFLLREAALQSGHFLLHFGEPGRLKIARQNAVPFIERFLPLRLGKIVLAHLGVQIAKVSQYRGIVAFP